MSSETPKGQVPNNDVDHGKEGHHLPPVLVLVWLGFIVWGVAYVIKNMGMDWAF